MAGAWWKGLGITVLALVAGCAAPPSKAPAPSPLHSATVACRFEVAATQRPGPATEQSAYDCVKAGGTYTPSNPEADLLFWLERARTDDPVAQTRAGDLYAGGLQGRTPDYATAASWYRKAMRQDHAPAMLAMAALLDQGLGVTRDPDYARDLRRRASRPRADEREPPRFFLVEPAVLLSAVPAPTSVTVERPEGWMTVIGRVVSSEGRIREVRVNDQVRRTSGDGYFEANVELRRDGTPLRLRAESNAGQVAEVALTLVPGKRPARPAASAALPPGEGQRHALLIANQDYRFLERLETPLNDARDLKALLERRFGFKVTLLANATRRDVLAALADLRRRLTPEDSLLVFYAGHGELDEASDRGYWIPVDAKRGDATQWLSTIDVSDQLRAIEARQVLLVVDSCYGGVLNRRALGKADSELVVRPRAGTLRGSAPRTRVAMTSGALEPVIDGIGGRNSLYATSLLQALDAMAAPLEAGDLHREVATRFRYRTNRLGIDQRPRFAPMNIAGHEAGDFRFVPLQ